MGSIRRQKALEGRVGWAPAQALHHQPLGGEGRGEEFGVGGSAALDRELVGLKICLGVLRQGGVLREER